MTVTTPAERWADDQSTRTDPTPEPAPPPLPAALVDAAAARVLGAALACAAVQITRNAAAAVGQPPSALRVSHAASARAQCPPGHLIVDL